MRAWADSTSRCGTTTGSMARTSSGITNSRPSASAYACAASSTCWEQRGLAPSFKSGLSRVRAASAIT